MKNTLQFVSKKIKITYVYILSLLRTSGPSLYIDGPLVLKSNHIYHGGALHWARMSNLDH